MVPVSEQFSDVLGAICKDRYGAAAPPEITARLEDETDAIVRRGFAEYFLIAHEVAKALRECGIPFMTYGGFGNSLSAFLLGLANVNPLPAHYCCRRCKHIEFVQTQDAGIDLPSIGCPACGEKLTGDGCNLNPRWLLDAEVGMQQFRWSIRIPIKAEAVQTIDDVLHKKGIGVPFSYGLDGLHGWYLIDEKSVLNAEYGSIQHPFQKGKGLRVVDDDFSADRPRIAIRPSVRLRQLMTLCQTHNIEPNNVPILDADTRLLLEKALSQDPDKDDLLCRVGLLHYPMERAKSERKLWRERFSGMSRFSDLIAYYGMISSAALPSSRGLQIRFCDPDTVMRDLRGFGMAEKDAFALASALRFPNPKAVKRNLRNGKLAISADALPHDYARSLRETQGLFLRAQSIDSCMLAMKLLWFAAHDPKGFSVCMAY